MIVDKWWRHLAKTGTWRVIALTFIAVLSYFLTGYLLVAGSIAAIDLVVKSILYYAHEYFWSTSDLGREAVVRKGCIVWFTGLSGSGKTTVADKVAEKLRKRFFLVSRIDGDVARRTFSRDLGFSEEDRAENCRRATYVASYCRETQIVLASFISPKESMRDYVCRIGSGADSDIDVFIVQVECSIEECIRRDPKGMYAKLEDGCFKGIPFTGMHPDAPYEPESLPFLTLNTENETVDESADKVIEMLKKDGYV